MKRLPKIIILSGLAAAAILIALTLYLAKNQTAPAKTAPFPDSKTMIINSPAFADKTAIPSQYGCHGQDINPPLEISGVPEAAKSLVLIVDDPDAPAGDWVHWLLWNIDPQISKIEENSSPRGAVSGLNDFGSQGYGGPCPHNGTHRYQFKAYALDTLLELPLSTRKANLLQALAGHILDQAIITGTYSR